MRVTLGKGASAILLAALAAFALAACSSGLQGADKERKTFYYPSRQVPPEPVYNRLTYVQPPQVLPDRSSANGSESMIRPSIHLQVANSTLSHAAAALASTVGYSYFASPEIAGRPSSCNMTGSVDEIARALAEDSHTEVEVDHQARSIKFMPSIAVEPKLVEDSDEHQSHY